MGALRSLFIALLLAASPAGAQSVDQWGGYIAEASVRFGVPEEWIRRVMQAESGGRTMLDGRPITSRAGAMGLMQVMPGTWQEMRSALGLGADPHDPRDNILAGTAYLRAMYDRFGYPGLFAAYNAGPARFTEHLAAGRRLPVETIAYAAALGGTHSRPVQSWKTPRPSGVFVALSETPAPAAQRSSAPEASSALFVRLTTAPASPE